MGAVIFFLFGFFQAYLSNIPSWSRSIGDEVICTDELKLGLIAQSCFAPGFSTLMANIFAMRSPIDSDESWKNSYFLGTGFEMYTETLSPSFTGMLFSEASE